MRRPGTKPSGLEPEGMDAMQTLKLAALPLLLIAIWTAVSAHAISELATVGPALRTVPEVTARAPRTLAQARHVVRG